MAPVSRAASTTGRDIVRLNHDAAPKHHETRTKRADLAGSGRRIEAAICGVEREVFDTQTGELGRAAPALAKMAAMGRGRSQQQIAGFGESMKDREVGDGAARQARLCPCRSEQSADFGAHGDFKLRYEIGVRLLLGKAASHRGIGAQGGRIRGLRGRAREVCARIEHQAI